MTRSLAATVAVVLGFALLEAGVAVLYWPAALILAGVLLLAAGLFAVDVG